MELESPLLTLNQISHIFPKVLKNSACQEIQASTLGLIIDASNYEQYTQKITIIDHTQQEMGLDIFIRGQKQADFATEVKIGDILHIDHSIFFPYNGKVISRIEPSLGKMQVLSGYVNKEDEQTTHESHKGTFLLTEIQNRINILRKFSCQYFDKHPIPMKCIESEQDKMNPKCKTLKKFELFDIIAKVIECSEQNGSFLVKMTDDHHQFFMNFSRQIERGIYKIRSIVSATLSEKGCFELKRDGFTNFLKISSWMKSYQCIPPAKLQSSNEGTMSPAKSTTMTAMTTMSPTMSSPTKSTIMSPTISTCLLRNRDLPRMTLYDYLSLLTHDFDVIVSCEILDVITIFSQAFKKLVVDKEGDQVSYREEKYSSEEGFLISKVNLLITDPSMQGIPVNAYIYTFDGRGAEFMPDLNPHFIRNDFNSNYNVYEQKYSNFVNDLLQSTSYEIKPLDLILSPLRKEQSETKLRIIDTRCMRNSE